MCTCTIKKISVNTNTVRKVREVAHSAFPHSLSRIVAQRTTPSRERLQNPTIPYFFDFFYGGRD